MRGTELILFVRAQNQASATLRRIASDVKGLTHQRDLASRGEKMAISQGRRQLALEDKQRHLTNLRALETHQAMTRQLADLKQMKQAQEEFVRSRPRGAGGRFLPLAGAKRQIEAITAAENALNSAMRESERELDRLPSKYRRLYFDQRALAEEVDKVRRQIDLQQRAMMNDSGTQKQIKAAQRLAAAEKMQMRGRTAAHAGRAMQFGGLIGTAALGFTASQAAELDTLVTQAATQTRDLNAGFEQVGQRADEIRNKVINMMRVFPASQQEMSDSAYDIFSSINLMGVGFDANGRKIAAGVTNMRAGFNLMAQANRVAVAGNEDLATATSTLITVVNNFDPQLKNVNGTLDTMFDIIRFGRMRLTEFDTMMNRIAPAAKGAGQSLEDVGGAMAFLTERIPSQSQVATGIARLLQAFQHPDFVQGMEKLGAPITLRVNGVEKLKPLRDIMTTIVERFPELEQGGVEAENFFRRVTQAGRLARTGRPGQGNIFTEFGRRAFRLMTTDMDGFLERQDQIVDNQGEFGNAFRAMMQTQGVQWKIFMNQLRAIVLIIGQEAIPVFIRFGKWLQKGIDWYRDLSEETKGTIVRWAAFLSIASLVGGVLLSIGGGILSLVAMLRILAGSGAGGLGRTITMFGTTLTVGAKLLGVLKVLGGIGAISVIIKTLWTGDAKARDFLIGALSGAAAGFAIGGPLGALIGGITVPITLRVIEEFRKPEAPTNNLADLQSRTRDAWENALGQGGDVARQALKIGFDEFQRQMIAGVRGVKLPGDLLGPQTRELWMKRAKEAFEGGKITAHQFLRGMELAGFNEREVTRQGTEIARASSALTESLSLKNRGRAGGGDNLMDRITKGMTQAKAAEVKSIIQGYKSELAALGDEMDRLNKEAGGGGPKMGLRAFITAAREVDRLRAIAEKAPTWANWKAFHEAQERLTKNSTQTQQTIWQEYAQAVKTTTDQIKQYHEGMADAARQASETATSEVAQAAQRLTGIYNQIKEEHRAAFGELFSGPWLESEFGQTAEEWGITPDIGDLTKDLGMQTKSFKQFNSAIAAIARRGAPKELVAELKALGPDALDKIDVLRKSAPGKFNQFVAVWKEKQSAIEEATKIDFDKQLAQWFSYGKNIARNIIFGLQSEDAALDAAFKEYITDKFPAYINDAVAKAKTEFRKEQGPVPTKPRMPSGGATGTNVNVTENNTTVVTPTKGETSTDAGRRAQYLQRAQARKTRQERIDAATQWSIPRPKGTRGGR